MLQLSLTHTIRKFLEQLLIDMHLPCDSEESLEVASDERNEEQSSPIESPAKRPRNSEDDKDKVNSLSYLVIFSKLIQCLRNLHLWTK